MGTHFSLTKLLASRLGLRRQSAAATALWIASLDGGGNDELIRARCGESKAAWRSASRRSPKLPAPKTNVAHRAARSAAVRSGASAYSRRSSESDFPCILSIKLPPWMESDNVFF